MYECNLILQCMKFILAAILVLSCLVRVARLDYPLSGAFIWGDGTRDYLIANHIVLYKEFPLLGPFNLLYDTGLYNSPIYYYILALFLIIYNNVLTLGLVNIVLQICTIFLIYFIAKKIFDQKTAALATTIFSFNPYVLSQSDYIWQPHLSQPLAYLGLLLAILFYERGKYIFLFGCALSLALSFAIHNSAFPWIPIFLIAAFRHFRVLLLFIIFLGLLYLPVGIFTIQNSALKDSWNISLFAQNISQYFNNFYTNTYGMLEAFNINNWWTAVVLVLGIFYFARSKDAKKTKISAVLLLILFLSPIIFASFFNKFRLHYLTLSFGVITIFLAKISTLILKHKVVAILLIFLLIKTTTFDFQFLKPQKTLFENQKLIDHISQIIVMEMGDSTFVLKSYAISEAIQEYPTLDTIFLIPLEHKLNKKLAIVSDKSPYNLEQIGGTGYVVIACHEFTYLSRWQECLETFKRGYPTYAILKNLYTGDNLAIYLSKHEN